VVSEGGGESGSEETVSPSATRSALRPPPKGAVVGAARVASWYMWISGLFDKPKPSGGADVRVNIYDLGPAFVGVNKLGKVIGTGAFHAGVEVYGREWSFCPMPHDPYGTGIFAVKPQGCECHVFREALDMGRTKLTRQEVKQILDSLMREWPHTDYDLLRHNCCHFSATLCRRLGMPDLPKWVTSLAGVGAMLRSAAGGRFVRGGSDQQVGADADDAGVEGPSATRGRKREAAKKALITAADGAKAAVAKLGMSRRREEAAAKVDPLHCRMPGEEGQPESFGDGPLLRFCFDGAGRSDGYSWPWSLCMAERPSIAEEADAGVPRSTSHSEALRRGDKVEVFSNSNQAWCPGHIESIDGQHVVVAFQLPGAKPGELSMKVLDIKHPNIRKRRPEEQAVAAMASGAPAAPAKAQSYVLGETVEVYSNSSQVWCQGTVESVEGDNVSVCFQLPGKKEEWARKQLTAAHPNLRRPQVVEATRGISGKSTGSKSSGALSPTSVPPTETRIASGGLNASTVPANVNDSAKPGGIDVGSWVDVWSNSQKVWCTGRVTHAASRRVSVVFRLPEADEDEWLEKQLDIDSAELRETR